jgi:hypothetical protein
VYKRNESAVHAPRGPYMLEAGLWWLPNSAF